MSYECHITTTVKHAVVAEALSKGLGWKTSEIKRDPVLGDGSYFYLTRHAQEFDTLKQLMLEMSASLRCVGIPVVREKIEHIVYDTKTGANAGAGARTYAAEQTRELVEALEETLDFLERHSYRWDGGSRTRHPYDIAQNARALIAKHKGTA